jgi:hypothetical protein
MARRFSQLIRYMAVVAPMCLLVGCGSGDRARVYGTVTLDGENVDGGTISFIPIDANPPRSAWGRISDGYYDIPEREGPSIGNCRIEIRWPRPTGRTISALAMGKSEELATEYREAIPAEYNAESTLQFRVDRRGDPITFNVKSKK